MYEPKNASPAIKARIAIEKRIVKSTVVELLLQGFRLVVYNGGGQNETPITDDKNKLFDALMETDDDYLFVYKAGVPDEEGSFGWIHFVYGNDGWDVMAGYTSNLEEFLPTTMALIEKLA